MKKLIIAAAIILTSGVAALSVTKTAKAPVKNPENTIQQSDFAGKQLAHGRSDLATIE